MNIIAFSGRKQSGKTTAVRALFDNTSAIVDFADYLKEIVSTCFGPDVDIRSKEHITPCGLTVRELLQKVGTDMFRHIDPDCWVYAYKRRIEGLTKCLDKTATVLTTDVRFPNEVECIQELDGHVIRLLRHPFPEDRHESETALDSVEMETLATCEQTEGSPVQQDKRGEDLLYFDAVIDNRNMTIEQQDVAVRKLVKDRGWM